MKTYLPNIRHRKFTGLASAAAGVVLLTAPALLAGTIGVTDNGTTIVVDTHAGLVYTVIKASGDVSSIKWQGTELNDTSKHSQISSGLGSATVTWGRSPSGTTDRKSTRLNS